MKDVLLARRYAKALFDLALEKSCLDEVNADMTLIAQVMTENRDLCLVMASPIINAAAKKNIIRKIFEGKVNVITLSFMDILIRKGRETHIHAIAFQFKELYLEHKNIITISITTTTTIDKQLEQKIIDVFAKETNKTILIENKIDPNIIGGFVLDMGDYHYDASIKKIIARLHKVFDKNLFVKEL